jgi:AcrR family transcriptional regulator
VGSSIFTNRDKQREESRERLFQASLEIFRRDGFRAARVDDITLVAGLSRTSFYFHFPTKEDVLLELSGRLEAPVVTTLAALVEAPVGEVLDAVAMGLAAQWKEHRALAIDALTVGLRSEAERLAQPIPGTLREALIQVFERAARRGEVAAHPPAPMLSGLYLLNLLACLATFQGDELALAESFKGVGRLLLRGAAVKPPQ